MLRAFLCLVLFTFRMCPSTREKSGAEQAWFPGFQIPSLPLPQPMLNGNHRRLRAIRHIQLGEDGADVIPHSAFG